MLKKLPGDPEIEEMDPIVKAWMFYNWLEDYSDEYKLLENQGYMIGSFINPEAVKKMLGNQDNQHSSTDEEFDALSKKIREDNRKLRMVKEIEELQKQSKGKKKRKRKIEA